MAISRQKKEALVVQYAEQLKQSQGVILTDYRGLSVGDVENIRNSLRQIGGKYQVIKNRLMRLALQEAGIEVPEDWLLGTTAVGFCYEEVPSVARLLKEKTKELELLRIKGGLLGTSAISAADVLSIADLPSREILLAQVLGTIQAPAGRVAGVVAGGIRQVLNVLQAYADKLQESAPAAEVA